MSAQKGTDTRYGGYRFRSRLEARLAVFMDAMNWRWHYEHQDYRLPNSGRYLPDFYVTDTGGWIPFPFHIECKLAKPTTQEINKLRELCSVTGDFGFFYSPQLVLGGRTLDRLRGIRNANQHQVDPLLLFDERYWQLPLSFFAPIGDDLRTKVPKARIPQYWQEMSKLSRQLELPLVPLHRYRVAAEVALSARFEFDELDRLAA